MGTTEEEFVAVFRQNHANYRGEVEFTGFVAGVYGTMTIKTEGILKDGIWTTRTEGDGRVFHLDP